MYIYVGARPFVLRNFAHTCTRGLRGGLVRISLRGNKFTRSNNSIIPRKREKKEEIGGEERINFDPRKRGREGRERKGGENVRIWRDMRRLDN